MTNRKREHEDGLSAPSHPHIDMDEKTELVEYRVRK